MTRLRVLMSSHEFSPYQGSECAVGWNIATRLAAFHDVTVLCAGGPPNSPNQYRLAVEDYVGKNGVISGLQIVFVEQPSMTLQYTRLNRKLMTLTKGVGWQPLYYMGLDHWHREVLQTAQSLGLDNYDVVHQLTPISFLKPGYLWTNSLPFFWGPLGGMFKVPGAFVRGNGLKSYLFETLRSGNIEKRVRFSSSFRAVVQKASRIWTITENERRVVNGIASGKGTPMIDTSPPLEVAGRVRQYDGKSPLRLCWSGRHETRKAMPLLFHALAGLSEKENVLLDVLGEGPETKKWQEMARQLSLTGITWHGRLPYSEALQMMGQADVFVHSSYREAASMVVLEAMGWGLPVICHDACGMAVAVNDTCGIKVPFENPERSILGFREALDRILSNPGLVEKMSAGALRRAEELSWDAKVKEIAEAYIQSANFK